MKIPRFKFSLSLFFSLSRRDNSNDFYLKLKLLLYRNAA